MIQLLLSLPLPLALAQAAGAETVAIPIVPSTFERVVAVMSGLAEIVIALALIAIGLLLVGLALLARKLYKQLADQVQRLHVDMKPILHHAEEATDHLRHIAKTARGEADSFTHLVEEARGRLEKATGQAERRLREFDALLGVMQEEAEQIFIGTASTARGMRAGAQEFARLRDAGREAEYDPYADELDEMEELDEDAGFDDDDEELHIRVEPRARAHPDPRGDR